MSHEKGSGQLLCELAENNPKCSQSCIWSLIIISTAMPQLILICQIMVMRGGVILNNCSKEVFSVWTEQTNWHHHHFQNCLHNYMKIVWVVIIKLDDVATMFWIKLDQHVSYKWVNKLLLLSKPSRSVFKDICSYKYWLQWSVPKITDSQQVCLFNFSITCTAAKKLHNITHHNTQSPSLESWPNNTFPIKLCDHLRKESNKTESFSFGSLNIIYEMFAKSLFNDHGKHDHPHPEPEGRPCNSTLLCWCAADDCQFCLAALSHPKTQPGRTWLMSADTGSDPDPVATSEQINLVARLPLHLHPPRGGPRSVMVRERDLTKPCDDDEPALLCVSIIPGSEGGGFLFHSHSRHLLGAQLGKKKEKEKNAQTNRASDPFTYAGVYFYAAFYRGRRFSTLLPATWAAVYLFIHNNKNIDHSFISSRACFCKQEKQELMQCKGEVLCFWLS